MYRVTRINYNDNHTCVHCPRVFSNSNSTIRLRTRRRGSVRGATCINNISVDSEVVVGFFFFPPVGVITKRPLSIHDNVHGPRRKGSFCVRTPEKRRWFFFFFVRFFYRVPPGHGIPFGKNDPLCRLRVPRAILLARPTGTSAGYPPRHNDNNNFKSLPRDFFRFFHSGP